MEITPFEIPDSIKGDKRIFTIAGLEDRINSINFPNPMPKMMRKDFGTFRETLNRATIDGKVDVSNLNTTLEQLILKHNLNNL